MAVVLTRRVFSALVGALAAGGALARPGAAFAADKADKDLGRALAALETRIDARLGVNVLDTATGRTWGHRADERFPMCSTFKALACGAVLARVDEGKERLDRRVRCTAGDLVAYSPTTKERVGDGMTMAEICEAAMTLSDNTAANLILDSLGGPAALTAFLRTLGDATTRLDRRETALNTAIPGDPRDTTTPAAMAGSIRALAVGDRLSAASRDRFAAWMVASKTGDARLRAGLPKNWRVGDKTGTGDYGTANDVAVVWPPGRAPLVVSAYITQSKASLDERNAVIAAVGRLVREWVDGA